jgi:type VI protein secretion system component Hcp
MQRHYWLWAGILTLLMTMPAHAQQGTLFICGAPDVVGSPSVTEIGGVDVAGCSDVLGLSSGLEVELGSGPRGRGRPTCDLVEVLKPLDPASPVYLTLAFQGTSVQRIDILFFTPDPDVGIQQQLFELSLRQSFVVGVSQELVDGQVVERVTFAPTRIVATFVETGTVADVRCDGRV